MSDPMSLGWGPATIEVYRSDDQVGVHAFNHELATVSGRERSLRFARARLDWFRLQLPAGASQEVVFDDRGQDVEEAARAEIRAALPVPVTFLSETSGGVQPPR